MSETAPARVLLEIVESRDGRTGGCIESKAASDRIALYRFARWPLKGADFIPKHLEMLYWQEVTNFDDAVAIECRLVGMA